MPRAVIYSLVVFVCLASTPELPALPAKPEGRAQIETAAKWKGFQFLLGTWSGEGLGPGGKGSGTLTVEPALDGAILKAVNSQDFSGNEKQPRFMYRGMMLIASPTKALFVDNEGHVLHYAVRVTAKKIVFTSAGEAIPVSPRFRFSYTLLEDGKLNCAFDIAPMDTPNIFSIHVEGTASRKQ